MSLIFCACLMALPCLADPPLPYIRMPATQGNTTYFVADDEIWRVANEGGLATRLSAPGFTRKQAFPVPSADGKWIAFVRPHGQFEEIYLMPAEGGTPRRLTWRYHHPEIWGFADNGDILFSDTDGPPARTLLTVNMHSGVVRQLPVSQASDGALSTNGHTLYFTRGGMNNHDNARLYRGGARGRVWKLDLTGQSEAAPLLKDAGDYAYRPMPYASSQGERIAFLSDRDGTVNLWSVGANGHALRQHTFFKQQDIRHASLDGHQAALAVGSELYRIDLNDSRDHGRHIQPVLNSPMQDQAAFAAEIDPDSVQHAFAPDGLHAAFIARGRLAIADPNGALHERPYPANGACTLPQFGIDSASLYALCSFSGEYGVWRFPVSGEVPAQQITIGHTGQPELAAISPDGRQLAYTDNLGRLFLVEVHGTQPVPPRQIPLDALSSSPSELTWSPDNVSLILTAPGAVPERARLLHVQTATGRQTWLTTSRYASWHPVFSDDGSRLLYRTERDFGASQHANQAADRALNAGLRSYERMQMMASKPDTVTGLSDPMPFPYPLAKVHLDDQRVWFVDNNILRTFALNAPSVMTDLAHDVQDYTLSNDHTRALIKTRDGQHIRWRIVTLNNHLPGDSHPIQFADWHPRIQPAQEWQEIFVDAWRQLRDRFFDAGMRGLDWQAIRQQFEPELARVSTAQELYDLIGRMSATLGAGHSTVSPPAPQFAVSLATLGAWVSPVKGGWRIDSMLMHDPELPHLAPPLNAAREDIRAGDIITAINEQPVSGKPHLNEALRGTAGHSTTLTLMRGEDTIQRSVTPVAITEEQDLRYAHWRVQRARLTDSLSKGRIGYVHVRDMAGQGLADFADDFFGALDKDGIVLDLRYNLGGGLDSVILDRLMRQAWAFKRERLASLGAPVTKSSQAYRGKLAVLINEQTYSNGESTAEAIQRLKLGTVIGMPISGAGMSPITLTMLDGGQLTLPTMTKTTLDGKELIEGRGVQPDIRVDNLPRATFNGEDAQLSAAIALLSRELAAHPIPSLKAPQYQRPTGPLPH
ncbi:PDZ domain-containing protein [Burkholderiaceae bacterium DAT-1]|nr:PDZ domain-containing protein [Burkholderiaceae bacterium DAT-1]